MKTGTGHSSSLFFWKFSHLNIDKVCHRQALFVFLPLLLLHIASHALALSPVSVAPFFSPSPIFDPRRQLCSKSRGLSSKNRRVFGESPQVLKRNKRRKSATRRFRSVILPPPHFHRGVSVRNGSLSKKTYGLFAARSPQFRSCIPRNTPHIPTSVYPISIYVIPLSFWRLKWGDSTEKSTFVHKLLPNSAQEVRRAIRYHTPLHSHFKRTKQPFANRHYTTTIYE